MAAKETLKPTTALRAVAVTLLLAAGYGACSALVPLIKLDVIMLSLAVLAPVVLHMGLMRGLMPNLLVGLLSGVLAVVAMWAVWFGFEHGWTPLWQMVQQGPKAITTTLRHLAATTSVSVTMSGSTTTHGPDTMRLLWALETALIGGAPVLGALLSPIGQARIARRVPAT